MGNVIHHSYFTLALIITVVWNVNTQGQEYSSNSLQSLESIQDVIETHKVNKKPMSSAQFQMCRDALNQQLDLLEQDPNTVTKQKTLISWLKIKKELDLVMAFTKESDYLTRDQIESAIDKAISATETINVKKSDFIALNGRDAVAFGPFRLGETKEKVSHFLDSNQIPFTKINGVQGVAGLEAYLLKDFSSESLSLFKGYPTLHLEPNLKLLFSRSGELYQIVWVAHSTMEKYSDAGLSQDEFFSSSIMYMNNSVKFSGSGTVKPKTALQTVFGASIPTVAWLFPKTTIRGGLTAMGSLADVQIIVEKNNVN